MSVELDLINPEIPSKHFIGLRELPMLIEENYTVHSKWTIVRDFDRFAYTRYFKYNSVVLNADDPSAMAPSSLRKTLLGCMREGSWLAINFDFNIVSLVPYYEQGFFTREVLDPMQLFSREVLLQLLRPDERAGFVKRDAFRLVLISRLEEYPSELMQTFNVVSIEEDLVREEDRMRDIRERGNPSNTK